MVACGFNNGVGLGAACPAAHGFIDPVFRLAVLQGEDTVGAVIFGVYKGKRHDGSLSVR